MKRQEISVLAGLIFTILFSLCAQDVHTAQQIRDNTLRLHIIANSDSEADQNIKLAVRDEILSLEDALFSDAADFGSALENASDKLSDMEERVNGFLADKGVGYTADCSLENFYFATRQYSGFALPQGEYTALTVRLGKGQGKNWWCVIYPALCSQSCGEIALENSNDFIKTDTITPRFKVVELFEDIKSRFDKDSAPQYEN